MLDLDGDNLTAVEAHARLAAEWDSDYTRAYGPMPSLAFVTEVLEDQVVLGNFTVKDGRYSRTIFKTSDDTADDILGLSSPEGERP